MEKQYCRTCEEFHEPKSTQTFAETRYEPAEYEVTCPCCGEGDTFDEDVIPCQVCFEVPSLDEYDECADCVELD